LESKGLSSRFAISGVFLSIEKALSNSFVKTLQYLFLLIVYKIEMYELFFISSMV